MRRQFLIITLLVLALRLPFLSQAIQGDDLYYLYAAQHAQIDPLHPNHAQYAFLGQVVDMRGHPHPPLDSWILAALLAALGDIREVPFHAAYILLSLIAAYSALSLARRFTPRPLTATVLFLVTPAFVINGNSLESDLPFLAFWLLASALFLPAVQRRSRPLLAASAAAMALAALTAYQAVLLIPILLIYGWRWRPTWIALTTPVIVIVLFQAYERLTSGALPAAVLVGYMQTYNLQALAQKLKNATALTAHLAWILSPLATLPALLTRNRLLYLPALAASIAAAPFDPNPLFWASIGLGVLILTHCLTQPRDFLHAWILIFFAAALLIFFAGSARYLLPIALPLAILVTRQTTPRFLYPAIALGVALSLSLAIVNYHHWDAYRQFAAHLHRPARTWVNAEWGLRYYLESDGALPLLANQPVRPGQLVVSSALAYPRPISTAGGTLQTIAEREVTSPIPLRIVSLSGHSAYSTTLFGLRPFDITTDPIDRLQAQIVVERKPTQSWLPMAHPDAPAQILTGLYDLENGQWRWTARQATVLLKSPGHPAPVSAEFYIPPIAPARTVTLSLDGQVLATHLYDAAGTYTLTTPPVSPQNSNPTLTLTVDRTFSPPNDRRELGLILSAAGFRP